MDLILFRRQRKTKTTFAAQIQKNKMSVLSKRSALYSILFMKCPHCHHGDLFGNANPYDIMKLSNMPKHCPVCNQAYYPQPGFYFGAMYVSYVMSVMISVVAVISMWWFFDLGIYTLVLANAVLLILLMPVIYRYSRVLWIHMAVHFSKEEYEKAKKK